MEADSGETSLLDLPNDVLTQILKLLPHKIRANLIFGANLGLQASKKCPTIWNYVTVQTSAFKRRKRNFSDPEDENTKLKKTTLSINPRQLVKFILNNHAKDIIELDMTGSIFETERDHNNRRKIYSRRAALNDSEEITNLLTDLLLRLPNIQRLSLRATGWESGSKPLPNLRGLGRESTLRELNLNQSTLLNLKPRQLKRLLKMCPKLETLFVAGLSLDASCADILIKYGKKLKSLDLTSSAASNAHLVRELPDLTLLINMKNEWEANRLPNEDFSSIRENITVVANANLRNSIWKASTAEITGIIPAIKNLTFCDVFGSTLFHKFVDADATLNTSALLEHLVRNLGFNVNVSVVDRDRANRKEKEAEENDIVSNISLESNEEEDMDEDNDDGSEDNEEKDSEVHESDKEMTAN